jgi:hypothetical protein
MLVALVNLNSKEFYAVPLIVNELSILPKCPLVFGVHS